MGLITTRLLTGIQQLVGGTPIGGITVLEDESVTQVLNVVPDVARRALSPAETGWWIANLDNDHGAADAELSRINPYSAGVDVPAGSGYPLEVPLDQDVWLLGASVVRIGGVTDLVNASMLIDPVPRQQAWGRDDAGVAVVASGEIPLALWGVLNEVLAVDMAILDGGGVFYRSAIRIPRNADILFRTESAGIAEFRLVIVLGLFPAGLGQDVVA